MTPLASQNFYFFLCSPCRIKPSKKTNAIAYNRINRYLWGFQFRPFYFAIIILMHMRYQIIMKKPAEHDWRKSRISGHVLLTMTSCVSAPNFSVSSNKEGSINSSSFGLSTELASGKSIGAVESKAVAILTQIECLEPLNQGTLRRHFDSISNSLLQY